MRIIIFGDSITQGFWDTEQGGWANRLHVNVLQRGVDTGFEQYHSVYALGVDGELLVQLPSRFDAEFERRWKDGNTFTIFAYGINDSMTDKSGAYVTKLSDFKQQYAAVIQKAKRAGQVALIGLAPIDQSQLNPVPWHTERSYLASSRAAFDKAVQELAEEHGCLFIPMDDVFGDDVVSKTVDGLHPNAEGHRLMFERVKGAFTKEGLL
ncbi:MAG: SGNH/GDSL hydrolase family protein [Minisyncoccota bacterium]